MFIFAAALLVSISERAQQGPDNPAFQTNLQIMPIAYLVLDIHAAKKSDFFIDDNQFAMGAPQPSGKENKLYAGSFQLGDRN
jgi:hypothetical protein